jgi:hypothetical protein
MMMQFTPASISTGSFLGRLKPRLEGHEVRLRELGGPAARGVSRGCASAAGRQHDQQADENHSQVVADRVLVRIRDGPHLARGVQQSNLNPEDEHAEPT